MAGGATYVNPLGSVPAFPSALVTITSTDPGANAGVVATMEDGLTVTVVAVPPTVTVAPGWKPEPDIVMLVPPPEGPEAGWIALGTGLVGGGLDIV